MFADIDPDTFNINPDDMARKISARTKALMPVSLYGLCCDLDPMMEMAEKHGIPVLNDAAQAFQAEYKGRPIARIADVTSYSLENSKHITTGEGGMLVTDDEDLAVKMRKFGTLGYAAVSSGDGRVRLNRAIFQDPNYKRHDLFGYNYRMPEIAAALGLAQTERLDFFVDLRIKVAEMYLEAVAGCDYLIPQRVPEGYLSTWWSFACRYDRDDVSWQDFCKKYMEFGGDGVYAAWALLYDETLYASGDWRKRCPAIYADLPDQRGSCPNADWLQPNLMQFVNNYGSTQEAEPQIAALVKAIAHFA